MTKLFLILLLFIGTITTNAQDGCTEHSITKIYDGQGGYTELYRLDCTWCNPICQTVSTYHWRTVAPPLTEETVAILNVDDECSS